MATLHPTATPAIVATLGAQREYDVLRRLELGLPNGFDVFHNVNWSALLSDRQFHGELDIVVVAPSGHLVLLEVKSGSLLESDSFVGKQYGSIESGQIRDVGQQVRRLYSGIRVRLQEAGIGHVVTATMLVVPDYTVQSPVAAFPADRIVDARNFDQLSTLVQQVAPITAPLDTADRERVMTFLGQTLHVVPDPATRIGQIRAMSTVLAAGLATWVPQIDHASGAFVIDATAGSGKTQLALTLLRDAHLERKRSAYVCFNRPLADHIAKIVPTSTDVGSFHEFCVQESRRAGVEPQFDAPGIFDELASRWAELAPTQDPRWDLLVIDETQDFSPDWIQTLLHLLKPDGRVYLLGDSQQMLYQRDAFELPDAVRIRCNDNFRSPIAVVETINRLRLLSEPIEARSPFRGEAPGFWTYASGKVRLLTAVESCVKQLLADGVTPDDIVLLSFCGQQRSELLQLDSIAGHRLRKFTGKYDSAGNAIWSDGALLADTIYRFKGQSSPVVVLCEIDFEAANERELRRMFVGLTRAQYRIECVLSERAAQALLERIDIAPDVR